MEGELSAVASAAAAASAEAASSATTSTHDEMMTYPGEDHRYSRLLAVLPLYCSHAREFESSCQKSPALLCSAEDEQSRGFLAGTFRRAAR